MRYPIATERGRVSLSPTEDEDVPLPEEVVEAPSPKVRFAILHLITMFHTCSASVMHRSTVTVTASHPSTKTHMHESLTESA